MYTQFTGRKLWPVLSLISRIRKKQTHIHTENHVMCIVFVCTQDEKTWLKIKGFFFFTTQYSTAITFQLERSSLQIVCVHYYDDVIAISENTIQ